MSALESSFEPIEQSASIGELLAGLQRRRKPMAIVAGVVLLIAILAALLWPPTYSSSATILIEEQEIPQDMVRSTITSFALQQIEVIRQRVLTLKNIMEMVEKYGLYDEGELQRMTRAEIVEEFIDSVSLELLNAEMVDPISGRPMVATIAFTLQFQSNGPRKALNVTNELVNLFLNIDPDICEVFKGDIGKRKCILLMQRFKYGQIIP